MKHTISEFRKRARNIKLVLADNDGVMTDTGVYYSDAGEAMKRFSIRDGYGVERLRDAGVETGIITGETSGSVKTRAAKLQITRLYLGVKDKNECLESILAETGYTVENIAYIGDDYNDIGIIESVLQGGITACPLDAMERVKDMVDYVCRHRGGNGAFRDFAEFIIGMRD